MLLTGMVLDVRREEFQSKSGKKVNDIVTLLDMDSERQFRLLNTVDYILTPDEKPPKPDSLVTVHVKEIQFGFSGRIRFRGCLVVSK